jgi:ribosome-associated protein
MMEVNESLQIPDSELQFSASRSGGPGGQNVNKVNSKVTIEFDVAKSPSLTDEQRARILEKLRTRINSDGVLQVTSQVYRTQSANRDAAVARMTELLRGAFIEKKKRKPTRVSRKAKEKRLEQKKERSELKRHRSRVLDKS